MEIDEELPLQKQTKEKLAALLDGQNIDPQAYLLWVAEKEGPCLLEQKILKENNLSLYKQALQQETQTLPTHIVNTGTLYAQLTDSDLGIEDALKNLDKMSMPIAIYLLFAGEGYEVPKYKQAARKYCMLYPQAVLALPEPYRTKARELINDPTG